MAAIFKSLFTKVKPLPGRLNFESQNLSQSLGVAAL